MVASMEISLTNERKQELKTQHSSLVMDKFVTVLKQLSTQAMVGAPR